MTLKFWVPGPLPGMNEIVKAAKGCGGRGLGYASMKQKWTNHVALCALAAHLPKNTLTRVRLECRWVEPRAKNGAERDPDNVEAGQKFLWDGLVLAKVLPNDKRANNAGSLHQHEAGAIPGVEVTLVEVPDESPDQANR